MTRKSLVPESFQLILVISHKLSGGSNDEQLVEQLVVLPFHILRLQVPAIYPDICR